ncbi:unnamed protein product [Eruca vesicaria subsp. sativa]|uniref:Secreted peptide n=1 Tax=Eruca vesicaria subsp. sativa TaxID=29727 RepID=A0ABC8K0A2_ERUVS|nr:unnamed protein product [Eruca vesicaria subsp. sativa]
MAEKFWTFVRVVVVPIVVVVYETGLCSSSTLLTSARAPHRPRRSSKPSAITVHVVIISCVVVLCSRCYRCSR